MEGSGEEDKRDERIPFFSSSVWVDIITKTQFWITERKQEFEAEKGLIWQGEWVTVLKRLELPNVFQARDFKDSVRGEGPACVISSWAF